MQSAEKSPHILSTSSNLLGICFIVLTSLKLLQLREKTFIDECTAVSIIFFMTSSILSFLSIRATGKNSVKFEKVADVFFLCGLATLFITTMLVAFNFIA